MVTYDCFPQALEAPACSQAYRAQDQAMTWRNLDRHTKYGNTPMRCGRGQFHHSKMEARRCDELVILENAGEISGLQAHPQPLHRLEVNGSHICDVRPDFEYVDRDGNVVTEDVKGMLTEVARLKYRLFEALYKRPVQLVKRVR